ncbi:MAG TPA: hypothetical protein DDW76_14640 [Cyanobacteria bacterium UBA11369]|nr:hypothetical protein [Cyanobacteria bacterium UBA11371]HBE49994.1 hypothetical protein [Cyanobacteria bacterium UBA11369]
MNYELHIKCSRLDTPYLQAIFLPASTFGWIEKLPQRLLLSHLSNMLARFIYQNLGYFHNLSAKNGAETYTSAFVGLHCF